VRKKGLPAPEHIASVPRSPPHPPVLAGVPVLVASAQQRSDSASAASRSENPISIALQSCLQYKIARWSLDTVLEDQERVRRNTVCSGVRRPWLHQI
jgi:hypothetical protein